MGDYILWLILLAVTAALAVTMILIRRRRSSKNSASDDAYEFYRLKDEAELARARQENDTLIWDGDISVYRWTDQELCGEWIDIGMAADPDPMHLIFDKERFALKTKAESESFEYEIPEGTDVRGRPDGEVYLKLKNCREFEKLIFHEETLTDGSTVPILSAAIFEHDGRGEIVIAEFVRQNDLKKLPEGFRSRTCIERNDSTPVPMIKNI